MKRVRELVFSAVIATLLGCQHLAGPVPMTKGASNGLGASQAVLAGLKTPVRAQDLIVRGKVEFATRAVQATSTEVISVATVNMVDPANSNTLGTTTTDAGGNFNLIPNQGFTPQADVYYLLDAVKGLGVNAPGKPTVRLRSLITWDTANGGWKSISNATSTALGGALTIRSITTAAALLSAFDGARVPPAATIGKVVNSGGWKLATNAFSPAYSDDFIKAFDAQLIRYLTENLDPVATVNGIVPVINAVSAPSAITGDTFTVTGAGFSPIPADNSLVFNTTQSISGAAVINPIQATSTSLLFKVPAMSVTGNGFLAIVMNNQLSNWQGFQVTGSGGMGSGGNPNAPAISSMSPGNGAPGTLVTIKGTNFDPEAVNNIVTFGAQLSSPDSATATELKVRVPVGATSAPVAVQTPTGKSNAVYFAALRAAVLTEGFSTNASKDAAGSSGRGWPGPVSSKAALDVGDEQGGPMTISGPNTIVNIVRTYLNAAASAGQKSLSVAASGGFAPGQEIMIVVNRNPANAGAVGTHEFARIVSIAGSTLNLKAGLANSYNTNTTQVLWVPNYTSFTVLNGASVIAPEWDGNTGGVLALRASVGITNGGTIAANGAGYVGPGAGDYSRPSAQGPGWWGCCPFWAAQNRQGESALGLGAYAYTAGDAGGGGGYQEFASWWGLWWDRAGGGGGGHSAAGSAGSTVTHWTDWGQQRQGGRGGLASGTANSSRLTFGGAGGGGWPDAGGKGGDGGGLVFLAATSLVNNGTIQANGEAGSGYSGGGAGGEIYLLVADISGGGTLRATAGAGGTISGAGSTGREKLSYISTDRAISSIDASPAIGWSEKLTYDALSVVQSLGYDTGAARPFFTGYSATSTLNGQNIVYAFSDSADNASWNAWTADITTLKNRYVRFKASLMTDDPSQTPVLKSMVLSFNAAN